MTPACVSLDTSLTSSSQSARTSPNSSSTTRPSSSSFCGGTRSSGFLEKQKARKETDQRPSKLDVTPLPDTRFAYAYHTILSIIVNGSIAVSLLVITSNYKQLKHDSSNAVNRQKPSARATSSSPTFSPLKQASLPCACFRSSTGSTLWQNPDFDFNELTSLT